MPGKVYVGLDLGTSGLKGLGVTGGGETVARAAASYPTRRPAPGAAEQDVGDWLGALRDVVSGLRASSSPESWAGIALSGMLPTLVTVDAEGEPTGPALTWEDSRAEPQAERYREQCSPGRLYRLTGQWVDGRYLVPMFGRLAESEEGRAAETERLLGAKDYLVWWLTGSYVTDPSTATGFGCYGLEAGAWDDDLVAAAAAMVAAAGGCRLPALPEVVPSTCVRPLAPSAAAALDLPSGLPVCVGAADSVLGALGLGLRTAGEVAYVSGTSTVILGLSDRLVLDDAHRYLVSPVALGGLWGLEMDLLASGAGVSWLSRLFGLADDAALLRLAAEAGDDDAPVFLPYLSGGEQGALWDPTLRGALVGLHLGHERRHVARGLLDGLLLESRRCISVLDAAGLERREIHLGGGGTDPLFAADLADVTGRVVLAPSGGGGDDSARGAAVLAAEAIDGVVVDGERPTTAHRPRPERAAMWEERWERHAETLSALRGLYRVRAW